MSGGPPQDDIPPPAAFLHRSNASVISGETATAEASLHTAATQSGEQAEPEASIEAAFAEATGIEPVRITHLETDAETAAPDIPRTEFSLDIADANTVADTPLPKSDCETQEQLIQRPVEEITPISQQPDVAPTPEPRNLTQNNSQYNNSNTYNVTYTSNNYFDGVSSGSHDSGGGGGGGGGGRWRALGFSPFCACPLALILICLFFVIAAIYGLATFWSNTVSSIQSLTSAVTSFFTLSFLASRPTTQAGTSPTITIIKPTMTDEPTPIIDSPEGIIKAFDDLDHWVKQLQDCREAGEKTAEHQLFFQGFDVSVNAIGGMRDGWAIVMEDILTLEKKLRNAFGPLDRDVTKLGQDLGANPAAKRWIQKTRASTWDKFLDSMPWSSHYSPIQVLLTNHERIRMLSVNIQKAQGFFARLSLTGIRGRIDDLSRGSCTLRNSIEVSGGKLSRTADKNLREGINAVVSRGNLLCDLLLQAYQRVWRIEQLLDKAMDDKQTVHDLGQTMLNLAKLKTVSLADIKMMELELQLWVGKMTGPIKKLHFVDLDK
ncbi:uncharacterized protein NECHADRAFT_89045 [Fusarium vanettenii 77-13-4]|uniref:Uncharacterized protein n=1 Tax=Fusarium vanettenii (strain ATCC MYA-4622 / CBS 123669 / FGSC 9596 / NRRL 45880 / 77-13-4) TaxID=660122 RepID=C7ZQ00_FUSV7|nr:uncharacterized protein NECHADRAFT_89045 [Fusarium vanettenii 77-13-4]EEU33915.1 predicted protein [Fusarium vanettenii 77-13-4]